MHHDRRATSIPRSRARQDPSRHRRAGQCGKGHARPARAHRDSRPRVRPAADRQLGGRRRQGDRARGPLREHGGATAARGGGPHQRDRGRRHHHRHRAGPFEDPGGTEIPRGRHESDGPETLHREQRGRRAVHRAAQGRRIGAAQLRLRRRDARVRRHAGDGRHRPREGDAPRAANAASIASLVLAIDCMVANAPKKPSPADGLPGIDPEMY